jgi:hypothetical protein
MAQSAVDEPRTVTYYVLLNSSTGRSACETQVNDEGPSGCDEFVVAVARGDLTED